MTLMFLSAVLVISSQGWTAPLNRTHVPVEANWVLHVDLDAFGGSEMWRLVSQEISDENQRKIDAITNLLGTDPTKDIYGATLYGMDAKEENAVVMIYGQFDKEKLLSLLALNEAYAESNYNGQKLYHWLDEKDHKQKVGTFATDSLIVISQSELAVQATVDLLAGQGNSLASQEGAPLSTLVEAPEDAFLVMAVDRLADLSEGKHDAAILEKSKMMAVVVAENDGDMYLYVDLTAETIEAALQIEQVLGGIRAFIELTNTKRPEVASLVQAVTLERNENQLLLTIRYPSVELFEMIKNRNDSSVEVSE